MTVLPLWSLPCTRYSLSAQQVCCRRVVIEGVGWEEAVPPTQDRVAEVSTVRRWVQERARSLVMREMGCAVAQSATKCPATALAVAA
jgi:ribosomal protein L19